MYVLGAPAPSRLNVGLGEADIALSPSGERIVKLAPSGASDAWRGEIPLSTPANQQAGKPPYLSPEGERATSHNVRFRSGAAFDPPLWRSHGEVAARSTDGGAYGAPSLPLHHSASRAIPRQEARRVGKACVNTWKSR